MHILRHYFTVSNLLHFGSVLGGAGVRASGHLSVRSLKKRCPQSLPILYLPLSSIPFSAQLGASILGGNFYRIHKEKYLLLSEKSVKNSVFWAYAFKICKMCFFDLTIFSPNESTRYKKPRIFWSKFVETDW
jgi:hypothetical protein